MAGSLYLPIRDHQIIHGSEDNSNWMWLAVTLLAALMFLFLSSVIISARNNSSNTQTIRGANTSSYDTVGREYKGSPINLQ